ncbi:hypothetical protein RJ640_023297 [Escallonia rubra]|uniref:Senescence regulator n=1 Tax=Escallonia rubra TaxID=112253 RepID=A0AA88RV74_9ASTE|nr:hypothetical protein RJ640_023297 [Escallonia rubra]
MKKTIDLIAVEGGDMRSSAIRFLGLLKQPGSDPSSLELDESDVVWSSDFADPLSRSPPTAPNSPTAPRRRLRQFLPENSGLSAALADDRHPAVHRKQNLASARMVPPVAQLRSESGRFHQSAPVNVPIWPKRVGRLGNLGGFDEVEDEAEEEEEEMVPPHEIVARSHVTFSVFEGVGRTLKGRDLCRVRNAVFQRTGFID